MSGWKFPLLALLFLAFCNTCGNASADGHDLDITGSGDDGITSYASQYGTAEFTIDISSMTDSAHTDVTIGASVYWGDDHNGDPIITDATVTDCSDGSPASDLSAGAGESITACISASPAEGGADIGDSGEMTVTVTSVEDSIGSAMAFTISVTNWFASSADEAQSYAEGDTNQYTISVKNIKVDESGSAVELSGNDMPIYISLSTIGSGWKINSDDAAWDKIELTATVNYLAADTSYDLVLDIQLVGQIVPASSYVGNSFIVFGVNDGAVYSLVSLEAIVADNFAVNVIGSGNYDSDSGCSDQPDATGWTPTVKNFGNTMDSFSITFDTSDAAGAGWTVDGATSENTGMLNPKFEHNENDGTGMFTMNVGLHIPAVLSAGTMHGFTMTVTSDTDSSVTQTQSFSATVTQCYGLTMTVDKVSDSANPSSSADFTISVTNEGNGEDTVSLATVGASEWSPTLAESELTITNGATSTTLLSVTVPSDASANAASGSVLVHAYSEGCGDDTTDCAYGQDVSVSVTANHVYGLTAGYYSNETDVVKDTVSVQEGMQVQMKFTVTNNGNGPDEIALSLANAPAWVTLGQATALIGPGQTLTLTVDVAAPLFVTVPAFDARGDHTFQVTATSPDVSITSTTGDLTVTVTEKVDDSYGDGDALEYSDSSLETALLFLWRPVLAIIVVVVVGGSFLKSRTNKGILAEAEQILEELENKGGDITPARSLIDEAQNFTWEFGNFYLGVWDPNGRAFAETARKGAVELTSEHTKAQKTTDRVDKMLEGFDKDGVDIRTAFDTLEKAQTALSEGKFAEARELLEKAEYEGKNLEKDYMESMEKIDQVKAKIAEFKEKGVNTDELEKILKQAEKKVGK